MTSSLVPAAAKRTSILGVELEVDVEVVGALGDD
jgi:hypothetical protein